MMTLPLATRLASSFRTLTLPLRQSMTKVQLMKLDRHLLLDVGLSPVDVEAMRRMW